MARPWERPKARAKARARARARASNGLMCVKEGRPNVMLKENSERKIAAPGGTRTHNLLLTIAYGHPPSPAHSCAHLIVASESLLKAYWQTPD